MSAVPIVVGLLFEQEEEHPVSAQEQMCDGATSKTNVETTFLGRVRSIDCEEVRRGRRHGVLVKLGRTGLKVETSFEEL
jgi:hypothetical protein